MSITVTARSLLTAACQKVGIIGQGEAPEAATMQQAFSALKQLIDSWNTQSLTVLVVQRTVYSLVSNQQTYTIGPATETPDFDTGTAARPPMIQGAGLVLNYTTPVTEIPLYLLTDDQYQLIGVKGQTSTQPTQLYYNPTDPLGTIFLWPSPTTGVNGLALYTPFLTPQFDALSAFVVMPPGYARALEWNMALELSTPAFGVPLDPLVDRMATTSLAQLKRSNYKTSDLSIDAALQPSVPGGVYNILTDSGA